MKELVLTLIIVKSNLDTSVGRGRGKETGVWRLKVFLVEGFTVCLLMVWCGELNFEVEYSNIVSIF